MAIPHDYSAAEEQATQSSKHKKERPENGWELGGFRRRSGAYGHICIYGGGWMSSYHASIASRVWKKARHDFALPW